MAFFAPVYAPSEAQHTPLVRQHRQARKRKRGHGEPGSDDELGTPLAQPSPEVAPPSPPPPPSAPLRSVHRTDPFHVAGHSREGVVPPPPFPHAASTDRARSEHSVEEQLAAANLPLNPPKRPLEGKPDLFTRNHVDNLTTVLHSCMLRGDWSRASRAWGLLLRTEIAGRGMDVRHHGRWGIGAELLMRRGCEQLPTLERQHSPDGDQRTDAATEHEHEGELDGSLSFSDEGFALAREYYERMVLQFPHAIRNQNAITSTVFYPALFSIWVFEVQARSKRARRKITAERPGTTIGSQHSLDTKCDPDTGADVLVVKRREIVEAVPIAQRMDELLLSPPFDTSLQLLQLRGMVGLWLSDLHTALARSPTSSDDEDEGDMSFDSAEVRQNKQRAIAERAQALTMFKKILSSGGELPPTAVEALDADENAMSM